MPQLKRDVHYTVDEKARPWRCRSGRGWKEEPLGIDNPLMTRALSVELTMVSLAVKAATLFKRDRDHIVKDGQVIIVDEFTGRLMFGRRCSDGLRSGLLKPMKV